MYFLIMRCQCLIRKSLSQYHTVTDTSPKMFKITGVIHVILTWLWGFRVIFYNCLVWFSLCSCLFWELWDNGVAILSLKSQSLGSILIYQTCTIDSNEVKVYFFSVGCYQARHCLLWRRLAQAVLLIHCRFSKMWPSSYHGNFTGGEAVLTFYWSP